MSARSAMLAKVHIARKALALEEDSYRALVGRITGRTSAGACDAPALDRLLREFRRLGWRDRRREPSGNPQVRKVYALWGEMQPYLRDCSRQALRHFVQRLTRSEDKPDGVAAPEFLDPHEARVLIEALKAWLDRARARERDLVARRSAEMSLDG